MRVSYSTLVKAKRAGRATSVRVTPTGTAVTEYQVPLGNRHSLKEAGVIGLPSWSDRATQNETWVKVPRLSATCPRRVVTFDGGKGGTPNAIFPLLFDHFDAATIDTGVWGGEGTPTVANSRVTCAGAYKSLVSTTLFAVNHTLILRGDIPATNYAIAGWNPNTATPAILDRTPFVYVQYGFPNAGAHSVRSFLSTGVAVAISGSHGGERTWRITRNGTTSVRATVDGTTTTVSTDIPTGTMRAVFGSGSTSSATVVIDWAAVMPSVASEPLAGTAQPSTTNRALSRPLNHADLMRACCA